MKNRPRVAVLGATGLVCLLMCLTPFTAMAQGTENLPEPAPPLDTSEPEGSDGPLAASSTSTLAPEAESGVSVWYGSSQTFGRLGLPQRWVNILGRVSDPEHVSSLQYSLNGGAKQDLTVGPDKWRLVGEGDYNIEIDYRDLQSGNNQVDIFATYQANMPSAQETVTVRWVGDQVWEMPYSIDWSEASEISDVAQIVDGLWQKVGDTVRPAEKGYDRLITLGDLTWQDYDVTVPVTIHQMKPGVSPGVGLIMRWNSHANDSRQPHYRPVFGAIGWYRWPSNEDSQLRILGMDNERLAVKLRVLELGVTYIFKMRVETRSGNRPYYRLKVWEAGQSEPESWDLSAYGNTPELTTGSVGLLVHKADASMGNVSVTPVQGGYALQIESIPTTGGTVTVTPDPPYSYGEEVLLTPSPNPGWSFWQWGGADAQDLVKVDEDTWSLSMTKARALTANFGVGGSMLTVQVDPSDRGRVERDPDQVIYQEGTVVRLTPVAEAPGWGFSKWTGPDAGAMVSNGDGSWSLTMDGDKEVTAKFKEGTYYVTIAEHGQGMVDNRPGNPYNPGETALLEPMPEPGWRFTGWGGPDASDLVPNGDGTWFLTMDSHKTLVANYVQAIFVPLVVGSP